MKRGDPISLRKRINAQVHRLLGKLPHFIAGSILASCLSPIDIKLEGTRDMMVISGQVSTLPDRTFVQVALSAGAGALPSGTAGAEVYLVDEAGNVTSFVEIVNQRNPGTYVAQDFIAVPGTSYHIRVITALGEYESVPQRVPAAAGSAEISYDFGEQTEVDLDGTPFTNKMINVYAHPTIPATNSPLFVRWTLDELYIIIPTDFPDPFGYTPPSCYVSQPADPQRIELYDGREVTSGALNKVLIGRRIAGQSFHYRHYFLAYQVSLTEDAFDYWRKVKTLVDQVGSVFDPPPSPITGNVFNTAQPAETVLGYFQAVNETLTRISLTRGELPFQLPDYCDYSGDRPITFYKPECLECIKVRNASFQRPPWFGE